MSNGALLDQRHKRFAISHQTSVAVVKAQLSGYIPVGVLFDDGHVRVLDWAAKVFKLQLQTWSFLYMQRAKGSFRGITLIREMSPRVND